MWLCNCLYLHTNCLTSRDGQDGLSPFLRLYTWWQFQQHDCIFHPTLIGNICLRSRSWVTVALSSQGVLAQVCTCVPTLFFYQLGCLMAWRTWCVFSTVEQNDIVLVPCVQTDYWAQEMIFMSFKTWFSTVLVHVLRHPASMGDTSHLSLFWYIFHCFFCNLLDSVLVHGRISLKNCQHAGMGLFRTTLATTLTSGCRAQYCTSLLGLMLVQCQWGLCITWSGVQGLGHPKCSWCVPHGLAYPVFKAKTSKKS
jgi:hypothetical protein